MGNRNRGYVKRGTAIDVQIRGEYFVSANIVPINNEKTLFKSKLSVYDTEADISVGLDKNVTLSSTYKTVNKDVTAKLNEMIDAGSFDEDVDNIENMLVCLNELLELQRKLKNSKESK